MNVIAHEMVHVSQKETAKDFVEDKNERNGRLIMKCFSHKRFPQLPELSDFHKILCRQSLHILRKNG